MTSGNLLAVGWIFFTLILAVGFYHLILWYIPIFISDFLLARMKSRGRKTNVLLHGGLSNADNCRIPRAIADSMLSSCIYDVSTYPLRIKSFMPGDSYWSISFYARNTVNFFVINDIEVKEKYGSEISIVLLNSKQRHESLENEIVVKAPSKVGFILVRMMVTDTKDPESLKKVAGVQRKAYAEEIFLPTGEPQTQMCQIHVQLPGGEEYRKLLPSFERAQDWVESEYAYILPEDAISQSEPVTLPGDIRLSIQHAGG